MNFPPCSSSTTGVEAANVRQLAPVALWPVKIGPCFAKVTRT